MAVLLIAASWQISPVQAETTNVGRAIIDVEVRFDVENVNRSGVACPTDGAHYEIVGRLVAPRAVLARPDPSVTVWVAGGMMSEKGPWRMKAGGGDYDVTTRLAEVGFASVTIDRLGFGDSGIPHGFLTCTGSEADTIDQAIRQLRAGRYQVDDDVPATAFASVALAGHSYAGLLASVVAYSFDNIDGLMLVGSAFDAGGLPPEILAEVAVNAGPTCALGGEADHEGEPAGYFWLFEIGDAWFNEIDPDVRKAFLAASERDPCSEAAMVAALAVNRVRLPEVEVPILFVAAEQDYAGFTPEVMERQAALYSGSEDRTVSVIEGANHVRDWCLHPTQQPAVSATALWDTPRNAPAQCAPHPCTSNLTVPNADTRYQGILSLSLRISASLASN